MRNRLNGSRVLLTGATSGIGRALALELGRRGAFLSLVGRRRERLEALSAEIGPDRVQILAGDLLDEPFLDGLVAAATNRWGGLDVLVNNAGRGILGSIRETSPQDLRGVLELDLVVPFQLVRTAYASLAKSRGLVVNVSSTAGKRALPGEAAYGIAKHGLEALSEALRLEAEGDGIEVLTVRPGPVATEFQAAASAASGRPAYPAAVRLRSAEDVATRIADAIESRPRDLDVRFVNRILIALDGILPCAVDATLRRALRTRLAGIQ